MDMWQLADELGLTVREAPDCHRSGYLPGENFIYLTPGMRGRIARSVLAHEIGHHLFGHRPTNDPAQRRKQEREANVWAALRLIKAHDYAAVESEYLGHAPSMAVNLGVADELLAAYQSRLVRIDGTVYVHPREGVGQAAHRIEIAP